MSRIRGLILTLFLLNLSFAAQAEPCAEVIHEESLAKVMRTGFFRAAIGILPEGSADIFESESIRLAEQRLFAMTLENPNVEDLRRLQSQSGVYVGPVMVDWKRPAISYEAQVDARTDLDGAAKKKRKDEYQRKIRKTAGVEVEIGPLTEERFQAWYPVYKEWVLGKEMGAETSAPDFVTKLEQSGALPVWSMVTLRLHGKVVGGVILARDRQNSIITIRRAAFDKTGELGKIPLAMRTFHETIAIAQSEGFETMSYGTDPAFNGEMVSVGLQRFKASLGFSISPSKLVEKTRAIQILRPDQVGVHTLVAHKDNDPSQPLVVHVFGGTVPNDHVFPHGLEVIQH